MKIITIFGPTASGKSALAVALARELGGEIINADSRQVYRGLPIITACPGAEDYTAVPHHLFEYIDINERYTAGRYAAEAAAKVAEVRGRGRVPVVVGGITSDRLYPLRLQEELAELLPGCAGLEVVDSLCGHDGFLVETEAVGELIRHTLELAECRGFPR